MHAHELADVAATMAVHGEQLIDADAALVDRSLATYRKASRCRLDRRCRSQAAATRNGDGNDWTNDDICTVEEILVSEILSRVVAAIAVAHDQRHAASESAPVARNIFHSHLDVKRRAIALFVAPHRDQTQADDFLALRRQCDRWTDLLLAYLVPLTTVEEFAASASRVGDFAFDTREHLRSGASSDMAVTMIVAGMRSNFHPRSTGGWGQATASPQSENVPGIQPAPLVAPNADLNLEIATALVGCFDPDFFDSLGHLQSAWLQRLRNVPNDSPLNSDNWWHTTAHGPHEGPRPARWRS
jgi:hypothetical protein